MFAHKIQPDVRNIWETFFYNHLFNWGFAVNTSK